ncbi:hypothetical protein TWF281_004723 [Arthrobotrys megalospora]
MVITEYRPDIAAPVLQDVHIRADNPAPSDDSSLPTLGDTEWPWKPTREVYGIKDPRTKRHARLRQVIAAAKEVFGTNLPSETEFAAQLDHFIASFKFSPPPCTNDGDEKVIINSYTRLEGRMIPRVLRALELLDLGYEEFLECMAVLFYHRHKKEELCDYYREVLQRAIDVRLGYDVYRSQFTMDLSNVEGGDAKPIPDTTGQVPCSPS